MGKSMRNKKRKKINMGRFLPESVECNNCHEMLTDIEAMDPKPFPGIDGIGCARCPVCRDYTWAFVGEAEAVLMAKEALMETYME